MNNIYSDNNPKGEEELVVAEKTSTGKKSSDHLYLEQLEFNPELRKSWLNFFVVNFRVVVLLIILLTSWGVYSFNSLPRESSPEVKIPIAVVIASYPGASPTDVEELVTKKLETSIAGIKDIEKITSKSMNSVSTVTVEFNSKADLNDSLRKLRDQVKTVEKDLPSEVNEPYVKEISLDDTPVWTVALTGNGDDLSLRAQADDIKDELEKIAGVREVHLSGGAETEIEVAYDPEKLVQFGISADSANQIIKATNLAIPAGSFDGRQFVYPIRVDSRVYTAEKVANLPLSHSEDGGLIYLKDVARVQEKAIKKTVYSRLSSGGSTPQNDITIELVKKTGSSIIDTIDKAKLVMDSFVKKQPGLKYAVITDQADIIVKDFDRLTHDFLMTIALVGTILFLIVGFKEALVAGLAVPLVFFATFGIMMSTGITLNFLSIFSLILSLGLLVDDAIVVVSATKQYLKSGKFTPEEAVLLVLNDFKVVLTTTTLTTVWAFLPLLMSTGIMGEYIKSIPITVSVTLISSLLIALMINHPLAAVLERIRLTRGLFWSLWLGAWVVFGLILSATVSNNIARIIIALLFAVLAGATLVWYGRVGRAKFKNNEELTEAEWRDDELIKKKLRSQSGHDNDSLATRLMHGIISFDRLLPTYEKYLRLFTTTKKNRIKTLLVTLVVFLVAIALPITGVVKSEFFPPADLEYIYVNIEAPTGLKLVETDKIVTQVENQLLKHQEISSFSTLVGTQSGTRASSVSNSSSHLSTIIIKLKDKKERSQKSYDVAEVIRQELKPINQAVITVEAPRGGPPAGAAFEARIYGDDLEKLDKIANELKPKLAEINGVTDTSTSLKTSPADYTFTLDNSKMELYSLNAAYVGSSLRLAISGVDATTILRDGKEVKVVARFDSNKLPNLESIQNLQILNLRKQPVFIKDVAKIELKPSVDTITRIDQKRVVLLSGNVNGQTRPQAVLEEFQKKIKNHPLPAGYEIKYGGENEQNQESVLSIIRAMAIAGILIISTLIIQFNSFKKAMIVLVTIPLALIGVFFGMAAVGINLSFPGLIGILALFGIVVKNAIILMDKINLNIKSGIPYQEAIVDAGKSRLEAIIITSICTILGIIPVTFSDETWRSLGSAIIFGLMLSSFLTLFIVPTLYMTFVKENERL